MTDPRSRPIPQSWERPIAQYISFCAARGMRPQTLRTYEERLSILARNLITDPYLVSYDEIMGHLSDQQWKAATRRARLQTWRGFWAWAVKHGQIQIDPTTDLPSVKPERPNPNPVPYGMYLETLVRAPKRTRLILRFAGEAGMRRGEIALINRCDLRALDHGPSLIVHGKGGKTRTVPLSQELAYFVRRAPDGYLFPGLIDGHLSARRVSELANTLLPGTWTIHKLRHMFASRSYAISKDLAAVQELLGHASPVTTKNYIAVEHHALRNIVNAVSTRSFDARTHERIQRFEEQRITIDFEKITAAQAIEIIGMLGTHVQALKKS